MSSSIDDSQSRSPKAAPTADPSTQRTIQTIEHVASNIREASSRMRDVVRALRESGAIDELTTAVHEAMIAARDTTREISETAKELKDRGLIKDTATAVEETAAAAREIGETARDTAQQVGESAPLKGETIRKAATGIKTRTKRSTQSS
jgi:methyl-accepting chemotaxis protein